jgi:hypothetical protein
VRVQIDIIGQNMSHFFYFPLKFDKDQISDSKILTRHWLKRINLSSFFKEIDHKKSEFFKLKFELLNETGAWQQSYIWEGISITNPSLG